MRVYSPIKCILLNSLNIFCAYPPGKYGLWVQLLSLTQILSFIISVFKSIKLKCFFTKDSLGFVYEFGREERGELGEKNK